MHERSNSHPVEVVLHIFFTLINIVVPRVNVSVNVEGVVLTPVEIQQKLPDVFLNVGVFLLTCVKWWVKIMHLAWSGGVQWGSRTAKPQKF